MKPPFAGITSFCTGALICYLDRPLISPDMFYRFLVIPAVISLAALYAPSPAYQALTAYDQRISGTQVTFRMVPIPAGKFLIGSPANESMHGKDEGPQRETSISSFWMGEREVTFAEWDLYFMDSDLPQYRDVDGVSRPTPQYIDLTWGMGRDPAHPANSMSQQAATAYCKWLYDKTGIFYRLPTEAEWEYACRAGATSLYPSGVTGETLKEYAYFRENSNGSYHKTGSLKPNSWGLYDMIGNLSEWTLEGYREDAYQSMGGRDPHVPPTGRYPRTVRGGSFLDDAEELRCANRIPSKPSWNQRDPQMPKSEWWLTDAMFVGFRVVRPASQPSEAEIDRFFELYLE